MNLPTTTQAIKLYKDAGIAWLDKVIGYPGEVKFGSDGPAAKKVQEMICVGRVLRVEIDGDFGPASTSALKQVQQRHGLAQSGVLDAQTWEKLCTPVLQALAQPTEKKTNYSNEVLRVLTQHAASKPHEYGGPNAGPWVRLYMSGNQGSDYPWCAGFVSFVLKQAAMACQSKTPFAYTWGCDQLAAFAKQKNLFVPEANAQSIKGDGIAIFLVRKTSTDWVHTGFAHTFSNSAFKTFEGNSNSTGSREGVAVVSLERGYKGRDFIKIPSTPIQ